MMSFEKVESFESMEVQKFETRVVLRRVAERNVTECQKCDKPITFNVKTQPNQVIVNLYDDGVWQGTPTYHEVCYDEVKQPYGPPQDMPIAKRKGRKPNLKGIFEIQDIAE